jgi:phosphohistidine phosphatase
MYTTNEEDQREAKRLQARLAAAAATEDDEPPSSSASSSDGPRLPNVSIDEGAHKYVLISAILPGGGERQNFVVSRHGAHYHRDAAEPFVEALERSGYSSIRVTGGGRIRLDQDKKKIEIYGHSYGFGLADHALSKAVVGADSRYKGFDITWSNEGY